MKARGIFLLPLIFLSACNLGSADIEEERLTVALIDEYYEYDFDVETHWNGFFNLGYRLYQSDGEMGPGLDLTQSGRLVGLPTERGRFQFELALYGIDSYDDYYGTYLDSTWFTLFVTEASTHEDCPSPANRTINEIYVCLGNVEEQQVVEGETVLLDINYFIPIAQSKRLAIRTLDFTLTYDADRFQLNESDLNSQVLMEVATDAGATVSLDSSVSGQLHVILQADQRDFVWSGRLMNLPFIARGDISAGEYPFGLTINAVTPESAETTVPTLIEVEGQLTVDEESTTES